MRVPLGGLVIAADETGAAITRVELQLDTCIHWLEIALEHLASARSAHNALATSKSDDVGALLDSEFKASVQAAVASATFFEALYAATLDRLPTKPKAQNPAKRRQSRHIRVAEQLRMAFGLRKHGTASLRSALKVIYTARDEAVHPSAQFSDPVLHGQLQIGVERRFVMFDYDGALQLVRAALAFSKILPSRDLRGRPKAMQDFGAYLLEVCGPLYKAWEETYGALLDATPDEHLA
jgi:hypothetical protein